MPQCVTFNENWKVYMCYQNYQKTLQPRPPRPPTLLALYWCRFYCL